MIDVYLYICMYIGIYICNACEAIADGLHGQAKVHFAVGELAEARDVAEEALKYYDEALKRGLDVALRLK